MNAPKPVYILIALLVLASAALAYDAISSSINPYVTVSDVTGPAASGKDVQVLATVADYSYADDGAMLILLTDGNATLNVTYRGIPPQGLLAGQKIVAIGTISSPGRLEADQLLVKCPSKYG